jgi:hypothetical protein
MYMHHDHQSSYKMTHFEAQRKGCRLRIYCPTCCLTLAHSTWHTRPLLGKVVLWAERCVWPWLRMLLQEAEAEGGHASQQQQGGGSSRQAADSEYVQWRTRLQFFLFETFRCVPGALVLRLLDGVSNPGVRT